MSRTKSENIFNAVTGSDDRFEKLFEYFSYFSFHEGLASVDLNTDIHTFSQGNLQQSSNNLTKKPTQTILRGPLGGTSPYLQNVRECPEGQDIKIRDRLDRDCGVSNKRRRELAVLPVRQAQAAGQ